MADSGPPPGEGRVRRYGDGGSGERDPAMRLTRRPEAPDTSDGQVERL
ncbi:MAG: hypothetical protein JWM18_1475, partial [Chloroflexi bacterium]|nr:hypothetical protein [Chloroflexota bacterium]